MRLISELYNRHSGEDIYVVGTGASLRVFPHSFLNNKITIGLNMAWRTVPVKYSITIHPDLNIPEFIGAEQQGEITWIIPNEKTRALVTKEQFKWAEKNCFSFEYYGGKNNAPSNEPSTSGRVIDWVKHPTGNKLYVWSSISQTALNLAANLGAKNIILIGCDNGSIEKNDHADGQHTRWKGVDPDHRYNQYYEGLAEVRQALRLRGVDVVSLQPFLGVKNVEEDFIRLCSELDKPLLLQGMDISPTTLDKNKSISSLFERIVRGIKLGVRK